MLRSTKIIGFNIHCYGLALLSFVAATEHLQLEDVVQHSITRGRAMPVVQCLV
jgi:hypothetical protein